MKTKLQSKKHYIIDIVIILVVAGLTFFYMAKNGIVSELGNLTRISTIGIFVIALMVFSAFLFQSYVFYNSGLVTESNLTYTQSANAYFMGFLGSGITPFKLGHYPFIFYYYAKKDINFEKSLGIVCINQIVFSLTTIITYLIIMILCLVKHTAIVISGVTINLWLAALVGFLFNLGAMILVILLAYCKPFHEFIIKIVSFILFKLKKIESRDAYEIEHAYKMQIYKEKIDYVFKHLYKFLLSIVSFLMFLLFISSIPYVIYLFFTNSTFNLSDFLFFFSLNQAMTYITNIIPVPGGTGVAEFSFIAIFGTVFAESTIGAAMVIWRVMTYYIPVILTFVLFIIIMTTSKHRPKAVSLETFSNNTISNNDSKETKTE